MEQRVQRRLAAVLAADVVGFSRLMEADESGTLNALKECRRKVIDPKIAAFGGRTVKLMGDGALVEFPSVVEAVQCALDMQTEIARCNAQLPADRRLVFRMGINLGDVIIDDDDIYGDGVNVAARLQELARPGGICLSREAHEQVRARVSVVFEDMGELSLKNIERAVRAYGIVPGVAEAEGQAKSRDGASDPREKPSVAVLPFSNMSSDAEQEFFADGLTEDLITELSRFHNLTVIARNSTFVYKGKSVNVPKVAAELGVRYVVEGSVRRAGNRLRITVQLIDAAAGQHVWAEKYDRNNDDIFDVQDEIVGTIVSTLPGRLETAEIVKRKRPSDFAAHDFVMHAKVLHHQASPENNAEALRLLDRAIELAPDYAHAHAWKACVLGQSWIRGYRKESDGVLGLVQDALQRAYAIDENDSECHRILAAWNLMRNNHDKVAYHQERGLKLNPNYDLIVVQQGELLTWLGQGKEAAEWIRRAMRLNPYHPERFWQHLGRALYVAGDYAAALEAFARLSDSDFSVKAFCAACHAELGDAASAARVTADLLAGNPSFASHIFVQTLPFKHDADRNRLRASLEKAGLPA